jgi:hypothetical protein
MKRAILLATVLLAPTGCFQQLNDGNVGSVVGAGP